MNIGSLFSGIGGLELGLERAGVGRVVWQVEKDPWCRRVLASHWPDAERFDDVEKFEGRPAELICGGFPCQDISQAGKQAGITGKRSGLWTEFARIIRMVRPRFVVVENVSALLANGMGVVLGELSTLGYDAVWDCVPAQAVGAPHRRDRVFVVAWRVPNAIGDGIRDQSERRQGGAQATDRWDAFTLALGATVANADCPRKPQPEGREQGFGRRAGDHGETMADADSERGRPGKHSLQTRQRQLAEFGDEEMADASCPRQQGSSGGHVQPSEPSPDCGWPPGPDDVHAWRQVPTDAQPSLCRLADGLPARLPRDRRAKLRALGNAVVPQVAEVIGRVVLELAT